MEPNSYNAKSGTCPDLELLSEFVSGNVALSLFHEVADHLETCPNCVDKLANLNQQLDPLLAALRRGSAKAGDHSDSLNVDKKLEDAFQRALEIGLPKQVSPSDQSTSNVAEKTKSDDQNDELKKKLNPKPNPH